MLNKLFISFLVLLSSVILVKAQDRQSLAHFDGIQTGRVIQLTFVIRAGNRCDGVRILRSTNDRDFSEIGQLTGVCGNSTTDETYSFTDISPIKNSDNYYQLDLTNLGTSDYIKIRFTDFGDKGYVLNPNQVKDKSILYFQNDCNDEFDFVLLDKRGKKVKQIDNIRSNAVEISKGNLKGGVYTFQLFLENKVKFTGPLTIQ